MMYLLGVLNGHVADFVFRRIGRVKSGDFFEANKQFIAPLPIPRVTPRQQAEIAKTAQTLQTRWTKRRDLIKAAADRLSVLPRMPEDKRRIWPELPTLDAAVAAAPATFKSPADRRQWADNYLKDLEAGRLASLQAMLNGGGKLEAQFSGGELSLNAGGIRVVARLFFEDRHGRLAEAYWRFLLLRQSWRDAKSFAAELCRIPADTGSQAAAQFLERVSALATECRAIDTEERAMNERLYELYNLSPDERLLVESARR